MKQIDSRYNEYIRNNFNYGFDKIRWINPVTVNTKIRAVFTLEKVLPGKLKNSLKFVYDTAVEMKDKNNGKISKCLVCKWLFMIVYK